MVHMSLDHFLHIWTPSSFGTFVYYATIFDLLVWPFLARYIFSLKPEDIDTNLDYNAPKPQLNGKMNGIAVKNGHISNGTSKKHT